MGLDIYVGPLCRYYGGAWQTTIQQWGAQQGIAVEVVRPKPGSALQRLWARVRGKQSSSPPDDPKPMVLAWRAKLAAAGHFGDGERDCDWPEEMTLPYETDKPDFDGLIAAQLWAAYTELGNRERPKELTGQWQEDQVLSSVNELRGGARWSQLYRPELWLPVRFHPVFEAADAGGTSRWIGSSPELLDQLRQVNDATWRATEGDILAGREEDFDAQDFESHAKWGFSILYALTHSAVAYRRPMLLDY